MTIFRHLRPLSTILWKNPRLVREGIQIFQPKINLAPITWYLGKTLVTSRVSLKSDKSKSTDEQNENKIAENQEIAEVDVSLILVNPETNRYDCPIEGCSKSYSTRGNLKRHINGVHRNLRPFECDICGESFQQQTNLDDHIAAIHEDLKLIDCPHCDEKFKNPKELEIHIKSFHVVTDHQCPDCKK